MNATGTTLAPQSRSLSVPGVIGLGAVGALATGTVLILLLHFIPPTDEISPVRRTISEYGLTSSKGIFDTAVLLVAVGSAVLFAMHLARRALSAIPAVAGGLWTLSLLVIVAFPKTDWTVGPSAGGTVHRIASIIGFVCLPAGVLIASNRLFAGAPAWRRAARSLGGVSLLWFVVIVGAIVAALFTGGRWWLMIPLGLIERLMALTEVLAIATLAVPLLRRNDLR
ncbi:DUF998 domain-containing protein [Amycolatopsis taiwanensis]|uniref:DUF998 domain-containing protein n=1 Tax=Amycolatopsis taiwanensis TaxID=342230 RepID=A0A9W6VK15_9PSEU|nr:DUF998 domain-containing protein [Amycolatopsis taiwanensis]GLY71225.1 hypothetical protein Atai01_78440 [Amycolatopsis taiwanensis]